MAVSRLRDPDDEDRELFAAIRQRRAIRAVQSEPIDKLAAEVRGITSWQKVYPDLPVGQVVAFAQAGIDPNTPDGRRLAIAATKTKARKSGGFSLIGETVRVAKGSVRTAMALMETPLQELQGVIRGAGWGGVETRTKGGNYLENVGYGIANAGRSTGWKVIEQIAKDPIGNLTPAATRPGAEVDLGSGFFTGGKVEEERRRDSERLVINDQPITTGRVVARRVSEPGTRPYNAVSGLIDMSVALTADPTSYAGRSASIARRASKTFAPVADATITGRAAEKIGETVGLARSHRLDVDPTKVQQWLMSDEGRKVKGALIAETDFDELRRLTNKKIPALVVRELADATDEQQVDSILGPLLGTVIRDKPTVGGLGYDVKKALNGVRLAQRMPGSKLDLEDADQTIDTLDAFMRNAKVDDALRKSTLRKAVDNLAVDNRQGMYEVVSDVMAETGGILQRQGVDATRAQQMTKIFLDAHSNSAKYNIDEFGQEASKRTVTIDGVDVDLPKPHLLAETLNRVVPLPDARDIRRMTSRFGRILNNKAIDVPTLTLDWVMQDGWKPLTLLRGAWAVRVIGEEQVRMAASGLHSAFSHPISYLGWMLAGDGIGSRTVAKAGVKAGRGELDVIGGKFADTVSAADANVNPSEFLQSLSLRNAKHRGLSPRKQQVLNRFDVYQRGAPEYIDSWADELLYLHNDDVARVVAQKGAAWAKAWFQRGSGDRFRQMLAQVPDNADLLTPAGADSYIDTIAKRIQVKTGNDSALIDAIATGKLNGQELLARTASGKLGINDAVRVDLDAYMRGGVGPQFVKGDMVVTAGRKGEALEWMDQALDAAFSFAMGIPTSKLSRSVAFKQNYWTRLEELVQYSDANTRSLIIDGARRADLPADQIARMEGYVAKGNLTLEEADAIAKGYALENVKKLLYDASERTQFFDVTRLIFPFGEAWKEVIERWGKLMLERPQTVRRFQQTIEGARDSGFFHTNTNDEEVFTYPASRWLTDKLIGVPVPLTGRVQGLSLMSEVMPGVGPVVQIPAGFLIPNRPEWDWVREQLLPFGEHETKGGLAESFFPPWLQKMQTAGYLNPLVEPNPEQERLFANTVGGVLDYMISSGEYPRPQTEEEMADLVDEATERAKHLYVIRGATQFFAPSAPSPEMLAADKAGNLMVAQVMIDDLHEMENDEANGGYDTAFSRWLEKYGEAAYTVAQPKSKMLVYGAPVTEDGEDWVRKNMDVKRAYPNTYGFFAPTTGEFSFDAWRRVVESGEAEPLNPIERLKLANARIAREIYEAEKEEFGPSPNKEQRAYLSKFRRALEAEYPGFGSVSGVGNKVETPDAINEIALAVKNPKLAKTDVGIAITEYLSARDEAQADADALGLQGFQQAKALAPTRDWLRQMAAALVQEHPDFAPVWEQLFERELTDDNVEEG